MNKQYITCTENFNLNNDITVAHNYWVHDYYRKSLDVEFGDFSMFRHTTRRHRSPQSCPSSMSAPAHLLACLVPVLSLVVLCLTVGGLTCTWNLGCGYCSLTSCLPTLGWEEGPWRWVRGRGCEGRGCEGSEGGGSSPAREWLLRRMRSSDPERKGRRGRAGRRRRGGRRGRGGKGER